jgi:hypothetical protein
MSDDAIVEEARRVRDYLIAAGSRKAAALQAALRPFDVGTASDEDLAALRETCSTIFPQIERATLIAVLNGTFRLGPDHAGDRRSLLSTTKFVGLFGLILMIASLHWTNWSTRAAAAMSNLERVRDIQRSIDVDDIVRTVNFCNYIQNVPDDNDVSRFVSTAREIAYYDAIWLEARNTATRLQREFIPFPALRDRVRLWVTTGGQDSLPPAAQIQLGGAGPPPAAPAAPDAAGANVQSLSEDLKDHLQPVPLGAGHDDQREATAAAGQSDASQDASPTPDPASQGELQQVYLSAGQSVCDQFNQKNYRLSEQFDWYKSSLARVGEIIPLETRDSLFKGGSEASIEVLQTRLAQLQSLAHRWLLPVLYGALGAVIFCLVRALRATHLLPMSGSEILLRVGFGAFVGYIVSALLIPSGMFAGQFSGGAPLASLAAFILGYSIDSFLSVLNRLNGMVLSSTRF